VRPIEAYDTVPLKSKVKHKRWASKGDDFGHTRGPRDKALGGR